jgi:hypothetical protein
MFQTRWPRGAGLIKGLTFNKILTLSFVTCHGVLARFASRTYWSIAARAVLAAD